MSRLVASSRLVVALASSLVLAACGAPDTIPSSPGHPAAPGAPMASAAPGAPAAPDEHAGHDRGEHAGHDMAGHDHAAMDKAAGPDAVAIATAEKAAFEKARPIFERACAPCHSAKGAKPSEKAIKELSLDGYPFGGEHGATAGPTIRKVLGVEGGEKATMPKNKPGSIVGADLEAIVAWTKAFDASHAAGLHDHAGHGAHH